MKKILIISIISVMAVAMSSCAGMLDDVSPKHAIPSDKLSEDDLGRLTNGVLYNMEGFTQSFWLDGDVLSENYIAGPGGKEVMAHDLTATSSSSTAKSRWQKGFTTLYDVNSLLSSAGSSSSAAAREARGTALFCRAYIYFNLTIRFGCVPLLTATTNNVVPFEISDAHQAKVWARIINDLENAEKELNNFTSPYYPSKEACWALLTKVYMWMGDRENTLIYANKLIGHKSFELSKTSTSYAEMFVAGNTNKEVILSWANKRASGFLTLWEAINDVDGSWTYSPAEKLHSSLFSDSSYASADHRKAPTFKEDDALPIIKFPNGNDALGQYVKNTNASASPLMVLRLADIYLAKAEMQGEVDGLATMKEFMKSRYDSVSLPDAMSAKEYQNLILDENQREFFAEGHRWFDIKRTRRTDLYTNWAGDYLLNWPIPQDERDLAGHNNYPQNPGYTE